jgi:hypothetical protein
MAVYAKTSLYFPPLAPPSIPAKSTMSYQHDVFISYRGQKLWTPWVRDHFKKLLIAYLQQELGSEPDIFVDERIHVGQDWVKALGEHLATSKVLVVIFSGDYFGSDWCLHELDLMIARSHLIESTLIVPVVVHDGNLIPPEAKRIQCTDMSKYRIAYINETTHDYQEFSKSMGKLAPDVARAINSAPVFNTEWIIEYQARFNEVFEAVNKKESLDPRHFIAKRPPKLTTAPKLI